VLPAQKIWRHQDRLIEKDSSSGSASAPPIYADVYSTETCAPRIARIGLPAVIKTAASAMTGKGQAIIREGDDPGRVGRLGTKSAILEAFIPFEREISVIAAAPRGHGHVELLRRHRKTAS